MIERIAQKATEYLVKLSAIEKDDYEIYKYAFTCLFMTVLPAILVLSIWSARGEGSASIVILITFMVLRRFSGGYHTKHAATCLVSSTLALYLAVEITHRLDGNRINYIILIFAIIILCVFSPIDSENKPLSYEDRQNGKISLIERIIVFVCCGLVLLYFNQIKYVNSIFVGIILTAIT